MQPRLCRGTTILALRTPQFIIVGADSKKVAVGGCEEYSECKIRQVDNMFFACAGLLHDTAGRFNVFDTVREVRSKDGTILQTADAVEKALLPSLSGMIEELKQSQPAYYDERLKEKNIAEVLFFGIEGRTPTMYWRTFQGFSPIRILRANYEDCNSELMLAALGECANINRVLDHQPSYWKAGFVESINSLIGLEITARPNLVGFPIDILLVTPDEVRWLQQKPECPAVYKVW